MRPADRIAVHSHLADVAELADAQASGACALRGVEVRLLSSALSLLRAGCVGELVKFRVAEFRVKCPENEKR